MNNDYKFDLQKFNKEFNSYNNKLLLDLKKKDDDYLSSKKYYDKKFNPLNYSINTHIKYFVNNFFNKLFDGEIIISKIFNDDMLLFHISIIMLFLSMNIYMCNKLLS
jgi:hypothetical protein